MISASQLNQIKQMSIVAYLQRVGSMPVKSVGNELVYYSPKHEENTPSFYVNPEKNVFHDFSGNGERGDLIRLVQYLNGCSFLDAINVLTAFQPHEKTPSFSFSGQSTEQPKQTALVITYVQPIQNGALVAYLNSRKISLSIAATCLQEVHYQAKGKRFYALGFKNDKGGYELRSKLFKGCTTPKWFTSLEGDSTDAVNVFEGVFDYLSCCELFNTTTLRNPTIVLNSLSFLKDVLPNLTKYSLINAFLDNDKAGKQALERLAKSSLPVCDCSTYYPNSKDFNDHLLGTT